MIAMLAKVIANKLINAVRYVKARGWGNDVRLVQQAAPFGIDSVPQKNMVAVYLPTGQKGDSVVVGYLNKNQLAAAGEFRTFSEDADGNVAFYIHQKADGTCEIGGTGDYLTRFDELKAGFDDLKSDFNDLVQKHNSLLTEYKTHIHGGGTGPGGNTLVMTPTSTQTNAATSSASIDNAKIEEIETIPHS